MTFIGAIFTSTCHTEHLNPKSMAKLICELCGDPQLAVCLKREGGAIWRPPEHSMTSDRLENGPEWKQLHAIPIKGDSESRANTAIASPLPRYYFAWSCWSVWEYTLIEQSHIFYVLIEQSYMELLVLVHAIWIHGMYRATLYLELQVSYCHIQPPLCYIQRSGCYM